MALSHLSRGVLTQWKHDMEAELARLERHKDALSSDLRAAEEKIATYRRHLAQLSVDIGEG